MASGVVVAFRSENDRRGMLQIEMSHNNRFTSLFRKKGELIVPTLTDFGGSLVKRKRAPIREEKRDLMRRYRVFSTFTS